MVRALRFWLALWTALILSPSFANEHVGGGVTQISPVPSWVTQGAANGTDLNFGAGLYWLKGAAGALQDKRSTPATAFDANGNLVQFPNYVPAIAGGKIRIDETRTNYDRNNSNWSAVVAGTPGTPPTDWTVTPGTGITSQIVGTGTLLGMPTISIRFYGSPGAPTNSFVSFDSAYQSIVSMGQTWTFSVFYYLSAGSNTNITTSYIDFNFNTNNYANALTFPSVMSRAVVSGSATVAGTTSISPLFNIATLAGPVDFTLTFALPQIENANIPASVASATVSAGNTGGTNGACTLTQVGGTFTTATQYTGTVAGGAIGALTVSVPGAYTTLPASPASVTGCGFTALTVAPTPTDNSAKAFPTAPILTSGSAVMRNQSQPYINVQACPNPSLLVVGESDAPATNPNQNFLASLTNAGETAAMTLYRAAGSTYFTAGGSFPGPNIAWPAGSVFKLSAWANGTTFKTSVNNASTGSGTNTALGALNILSIGNDYLYGGNALNGTISRVVLSCGTSLLSASNEPANDNGRRWAWSGEATPVRNPQRERFLEVA